MHFKYQEGLSLRQTKLTWLHMVPDGVGEESLLTISAYADKVVNMKRLAKIFKALSEETRLRIFVLLTQGEMCVCELMAILQLPQSTVSRHLSYLKNAGLVDDRRQGMWMFYRLSASGKPFQSELNGFLTDYLAKTPQAATDLAALTEYRAAQVSSCE